jgi:hypothetical protein
MIRFLVLGPCRGSLRTSPRNCAGFTGVPWLITIPSFLAAEAEMPGTLCHTTTETIPETISAAPAVSLLILSPRT